MFIYEFRYKLKPDADAEEMVRLVNELAPGKFFENVDHGKEG